LFLIDSTPAPLPTTPPSFKSSGTLFADCSINVGTIGTCFLNTGDLDKDDMPDAWEKQNLHPNSGWTDLQNLLPFSQPLNAASDRDLDGVSNRQEFLDGTNPYNSLSYMVPVSWTNLTNTVIIPGSSSGLRKPDNTTPTGWTTTLGWNADAISTQKILEDGQITFKVPLGSNLQIGLGDKDLSSAETDLDFAFVFTSPPPTNATPVRIRTPTATINAGIYTSDTVFSIHRVAGMVQLSKDGVVFATSASPSRETLQVDCSLNAINSQITECRIYNGDLDSDTLPDSWELPHLATNAILADLQNFLPASQPLNTGSDPDSDGVSNRQEYIDGTDPTSSFSVSTPVLWHNVTPTTIRFETAPVPRWVKYAGGSVWTNAEIAHANTPLPHSGRVNFQIQSLSTMAVGLTYADGGRTRLDLEFAISVNSAGNAFVFESDVQRADLGPYTGLTTFSIQRLGGTISYFKDGIIYYTSLVPATASLVVNTSFNTVNSALLSANIISGDLDGDELPDSWEIALRQRQNLNTASIADLNSTPPDGSPGSPGDPDSDTFTNLEEYKFGTDPLQGVIKPIPISWINRFNTSLHGLLGGLKKNPGITGTFNADATSEIALPGDGRWNFTATPNALAFGLTYANNSRAETDLEYAFVLSSTNAVVRRPESTTNLSTGAYTQSTVFGIQQTGSQIEFLRDGLVVCTSTEPVTSFLRADCSISTPNHQFDAVYQNSPDLDNDGLPDEWELRYLPLNATWQQLLDSHPNSHGPDNDNINLWTEYQNGTSPTSSDSDGDGMSDLWEIQHGLAANDPTNTTTDIDGDGLTNLQESQLHTDPLSPDDTDNDGMWDGYEVTHSLARLDPNDALFDNDGDRIPNLWEFTRSTSASDPAHRPNWDATVDASLPNDLPLEKRFRRLTEAVDSLPSDLNYRSLIRILSIAPAVGSNLLSPRSKVAIIGDSLPDSAPAQLDVYLLANADLYLDGIVLTRSPTSTNNYSSIQVDRAFYEVPDDGNPPADPNYFGSNGSYYYYYYPDPLPRIRIVNCLFRNINTTTNAFSPFPGAIQNNAGTVSIEHCTFLNCGLRSSSSQSTGPSIRSTAPLIIKNSIVWDTANGTIPTNPNPVDLGPNPQSYSVSSCLIQGGAYNSIATNPNLSPEGWLTTDSDPCLASASPTTLNPDIMRQPRPHTRADLGSSQWLNLSNDTDQDGVPDSFEIAHNMNRRDASDSQTDADHDGFNNKEEYDRGTDPNLSNTLPNAVPIAEFFTRNKGATFIDFEDISFEGGYDGHIVAYVVYNHRGIQKWLTEFTLFAPTDQEIKNNLVVAKFDGYDGGSPSDSFPPFYPHQAFDENKYEAPALFPIPNDSDSLGWTKHTGIPDAPPGAFHDETEGGYYVTTIPDNWNPLPQISWTQIKVESPAPMLTEWAKSFLVVKHLEHTTDPPQVNEANLTNETVPLGTVTFKIPEGSRVGRVDWRPNTPTPISTTPDRVRIEELPPGKTQALVLEPYIRLENPELQSKQIQRSVSFSLAPIEVEKFYETKNPPNFIHNSTPKDDPPELPKNKLYTVVVPQSLEYHVTLQMGFPTAGSNWLWEIRHGSTDVKNGTFDASGKADIKFHHQAPDNRADYDLFAGYDANSNGDLDPDEGIQLKDPVNGKTVQIHGVNSWAYAESNAVIASATHAGTFLRWLDLADALLTIFYHGGTTAVHPDWMPTSVSTRTLNCLGGVWSDWLTHNAGAPFDPTFGHATLKVYKWDSATKASKFLANEPALLDNVRALVGLKSTFINNQMSSEPEGTEREFPSATDWWDIPVNRVMFPEGWGDAFFAIARARMSEWKVRVKAKKTASGVDIVQTTSRGILSDLYDFNYISGTLSKHAATLQISHGNSSVGRTEGPIYFNEFEFNETWNGIP
jgi:hypothetical protein